MGKTRKGGLIAKGFSKRIITYHRINADIMGSVAGGVWLSQLIYWSDSVNNREFYKKDSELIEETGMTLREFRAAKKIAKDLGWVNIRSKMVEEGSSAGKKMTHYWIDYEGYEDCVYSIQEGKYEKPTKAKSKGKYSKKNNNSLDQINDAVNIGFNGLGVNSVVQERVNSVVQERVNSVVNPHIYSTENTSKNTGRDGQPTPNLSPSADSACDVTRENNAVTSTPCFNSEKRDQVKHVLEEYCRKHYNPAKVVKMLDGVDISVQGLFEQVIGHWVGDDREFNPSNRRDQKGFDTCLKNWIENLKKDGVQKPEAVQDKEEKNVNKVEAVFSAFTKYTYKKFNQIKRDDTTPYIKALFKRGITVDEIITTISRIKENGAYKWRDIETFMSQYDRFKSTLD